jgi:hypothetical protein
MLSPGSLDLLLENNQMPLIALFEILKFSLHVYIKIERESTEKLRVLEGNISLTAIRCIELTI